MTPPAQLLRSYEDFVKAKARFDSAIGFDVDVEEIHPALTITRDGMNTAHERDLVRWAVRGGRRAIFAAFGLGKSLIQLETIRLTLAKSGGARGLIVCPLGVRREFAHDAGLIDLETRFVRHSEEVDGPGIYVTNYESVRDGRLDPGLFDAVSLDEASVLRSFGSKTYQTFLTLFDEVPFRFVATATPSPNRYKELIHYAGYLSVMDTGQALTRFFQRDSTHANNLTLYPHKEREFWLWLNTWACFIQRPSDLGYSDVGYDLPPLDVRWHEVDVDIAQGAPVDRDGQGHLYRDVALGVTTAAAEKRDSIDARAAQVAELVAEAQPDEHFVIWHDLEDERHAIKAAIPAAVEIYGSQDLEEREARIGEFSEGRSQILATKPILSGSGTNLQRHCHRAIYAGVGFKFNDFFQSIHRLQRFQQSHRVRIDIVHTVAERPVVRVLQEKWAQHEELTDTMSAIVREFGLDQDAINAALTRSLGVERAEARGEGWTAVNNDTVDETARMDADSVDLIVTSIPFANHYEYTPAYEDFGHTDDNAHFWAQMDFLTPNLLRVLKPGRVYACHVKDRINFGNVTGAGIPTVSPFHAEAIDHARRHGFDYLGMITVVTDVVRENNQTYRLGWSEMAKDGTKMGVGSPEYVLLFHKPQTDRSRGYADTPVVHDKGAYSRARWQVDAHAFWRSSGQRLLTPDELAALPIEQRSRMFTEQTLREVYDYETHVRIGEALDAKGALPATFMSLAPGSWAPDVWHDVNRMLTLNGEQKQRNLAMHVCPLQFDIVDRLIERYSNPGDLVYDPFGGLMTVPLRALLKGRRGYGTELNAGYWLDGVKYLQAAERDRSMPTLFDLLDNAGDGAA